MILRVYTARVAYDGDDKLDVSRRGGDPLGVAFAPSTALFLAMRRLVRLGRFRREAFEGYAVTYRDEMHRSRCFTRPEAWAVVLGRDVVTLCCYCENPAACHRVLLARILVELGATYEGER